MADESFPAAAEGPVMSLLSKKLRALRKKQKRILQMEAALAEGKTLNSEQLDVLGSKHSVEILIEEYERLRLPLSSALHLELLEASSKPPEPSSKPSDSSSTEVEDVLKLLYFAQLFDVKPQGEYTAMMLSRTHERSSCLTYDYVTDDDSEVLGEGDLDAIASLGSFVSSRPLWSVNSHQDAIQACVQHARLWLDNSDQPVLPGSDITYAGLRGRLNKIMVSDYFSMTPAIKGSDDLAAAAGKYATTCLVQIPEGSPAGVTDDSVGSAGVDSECDAPLYQQKEDVPENLQAKDESDKPSPEDEVPTAEDTEIQTPSGEDENVHHEQQNLDTDVEHKQKGENQYIEQQHFPRKSYQNQRFGGGRGGGRRGYQNGRGRGGGRGGGYQNGRNQYYDSGYDPRNYYHSRGGRGSRSNGSSSMYNNNHGGHTQGNTEVQAGA